MYINRLFATLESVPKSVIPVGNVGVVIFYTGPKTADVSGAQYRHGELVANGSRGVWKDPMLPGAGFHDEGNDRCATAAEQNSALADSRWRLTPV